MKKYEPSFVAVMWAAGSVVWALAFCVLLMTVTTQCVQAQVKGVLAPIDAKTIIGPAVGHAPTDCGIVGSGLIGFDYSAGAYGLTQSNVVELTFADRIGDEFTPGVVTGFLATSQPVTNPPRPRISDTGPTIGFTNANANSVFQVLDANGQQVTGLWCDGEIYYLWQFRLSVISAGQFTKKLWLSMILGTGDILVIYAPSFQ